MAPPGQTDFGIVLQRPRSGGGPSDAMPDYSDRIGKVVNVVLAVSDVTSYASMLERNGVTLTCKRMPMPWGAQATFRDLYGNSFVDRRTIARAGVALSWSIWPGEMRRATCAGDDRPVAGTLPALLAEASARTGRSAARGTR